MQLIQLTEIFKFIFGHMDIFFFANYADIFFAYFDTINNKQSLRYKRYGHLNTKHSAQCVSRTQSDLIPPSFKPIFLLGVPSFPKSPPAIHVHCDGQVQRDERGRPNQSDGGQDQILSGVHPH
jgi:hypothetical protein